VLAVIAKLQVEFGTAVILITHDLGVIAEVADDVVVMYAGEEMETAACGALFYEHHHPYTEGLLRSLPAYGGERARLQPIAGQPPSLIHIPSGCAFHPRCPYVFEKCRSADPSLDPVYSDSAHRSRCWLPRDRAGREEARHHVVGEAIAS
jgi:oligopeptide/dipeptide ABC transporter ATP-binding protein